MVNLKYLKINLLEKFWNEPASHLPVTWFVIKCELYGESRHQPPLPAYVQQHLLQREEDLGDSQDHNLMYEGFS